MGEHLKNGFRDYPQTAGAEPSPNCKPREHQYGVIVQAALPTAMPQGVALLQLSRVVCVKCGSVVDPFAEFSKPTEHAESKSENDDLTEAGREFLARTGKRPCNIAQGLKPELLTVPPDGGME